MKTYVKYIGPLMLCGLIIALFINIRIKKPVLLAVHTSKHIQALTTADAGAAKYLFYRHMFVNVITH